MNNQPTFTRDPQFGFDPWEGPGVPAWTPDTPPEQRAVTVQDFVRLTRPPDVIAQRVFTGSDTIGGDIGLLASGLNAYMSYVDNFRGFTELQARFSHGEIAGIPWGYTSASNMGGLIGAAGQRKFVRWSAHYGFGPHICGPHTCGFPQAHWTQWDNKGAHGENTDRSIGTIFPTLKGPGPLLVPITIFGERALCADMEPGAMHVSDFPHWYDSVAIHTPSVQPQPPTPEDIEMVAVAELQGVPHVFVEAKDGSIWYTFQKKGETGWQGGKAGQQVAGLHPFAPAPK